MTLTTTDNFQSALVQIEITNNLVANLMKIPHYQKMGVDGLHLICAKARSLNIDPLYALNGALYNVKGKIGMGAETMAAMIREKGHSIQKDKASNDTVCILHGRRIDNGDVWTVSFSIQDAQKAGIYGDTWKKYQGIMLYNRAMSTLARQLFPDVIKGCGYTLDELKEIARNDSGKVDQMEQVTFEEVKPEVATISPEQAQQVENLLKTCSPEYQKLTNHWINTSIGSLDKLPISMHGKLVKRAQQDSKEYAEICQKYADEPTTAEESPKDAA